MELSILIIFALCLFSIYICICIVAGVDIAKKSRWLKRLKRWSVRFRWSYVKYYRLYKKFDSGFFTIGPILFYKKRALVYYRERFPREAFMLFNVDDIDKYMIENARAKLQSSIPFDFMFNEISVYNDLDIDLNIYRITVEGFPEIKKV